MENIGDFGRVDGFLSFSEIKQFAKITVDNLVAYIF